MLYIFLLVQGMTMVDDDLFEISGVELGCHGVEGAPGCAATGVSDVTAPLSATKLMRMSPIESGAGGRHALPPASGGERGQRGGMSRAHSVPLDPLRSPYVARCSSAIEPRTDGARV